MTAKKTINGGKVNEVTYPYWFDDYLNGISTEQIEQMIAEREKERQRTRSIQMTGEGLSAIWKLSKKAKQLMNYIFANLSVETQTICMNTVQISKVINCDMHPVISKTLNELIKNGIIERFSKNKDLLNYHCYMLSGNFVITYLD